MSFITLKLCDRSGVIVNQRHVSLSSIAWFQIDMEACERLRRTDIYEMLIAGTTRFVILDEETLSLLLYAHERKE
jgi:hypothetical protein